MPPNSVHLFPCMLELLLVVAITSSYCAYDWHLQCLLSHEREVVVCQHPDMQLLCHIPVNKPLPPPSPIQLPSNARRILNCFYLRARVVTVTVNIKTQAHKVPKYTGTYFISPVDVPPTSHSVRLRCKYIAKQARVRA
jgi:hypothetical protein